MYSSSSRDGALYCNTNTSKVQESDTLSGVIFTHLLPAKEKTADER